MAKGIFGTLKSLVVEDGDEADQAKTQSSAKATAATTTAATTAPISVDHAESAQGLDVSALDQTFERLIQQGAAFEAYAKFAQAVKSLEAVIPDEAMRYKAAQATVGADAKALIEALKSSVVVLGEESKNFEGSFVASATADIDTAQQRVQALSDEIVDTTKKLASLSEQKTQASADVTRKTSDLGKAKIDFASAMKTVGDRYVDLWQKVEQHLGTGA